MLYNLTTDRLQLTPLTIDDKREFHKINTHPGVRQFLWDNNIISIEMAIEIMLKSTQDFEKHKWGLWKFRLLDEEEMIGYVGLWYFFDEEQPELLYVIHPRHSGLGYATEASKAIIDYAFKTLGFGYIAASIDTPNKRSKRMCERLGMIHVSDELMDSKPTSFYRLDKSER